MARVMVIGGAGYIGSVCAHVLSARGHEVEVFDDLSTGHREAVRVPLFTGDIRDPDALRAALVGRGFDAIMHFAARSLVGESVTNPRLYFHVNVAGTATLLAVMQEAGIPCLVFSSTCAIYGDPVRLPIDEEHPRAPVSPYGLGKDLVERMLESCRRLDGLRVSSLRYFNAAGGLPNAGLGESHATETHLIPLALAAALGKRPPLTLFGTDWPTRDGTCIRDYIHVLDLAEAHLLAMDRLLAGDGGGAYNLGTGDGTTVREIMASVERVTGHPVPFVDGPRRAGDPVALYAHAALAREVLGWIPRHNNIDEIVSTAASWARSPRY